MMMMMSSSVVVICKVCHRQGQPMSWVLQIVSSLCQVIDSQRGRVDLINGIATMFRDIILDLCEFADEGTLYWSVLES